MLYAKQPCFQNLVNKPCGQNAKAPPDFVENVIGAGSDWQLVPGSFYVDLALRKVYYVPRAGEDMSTAEVVMPIAEELFVGEAGRNGRPATFLEARRGAQGSSLVFLGIGSPDAKLSDVHFENVTFEYATWLRPSQGDGYVEQQSGVCV